MNEKYYAILFQRSSLDQGIYLFKPVYVMFGEIPDFEQTGIENGFRNDLGELFLSMHDAMSVVDE